MNRASKILLIVLSAIAVVGLVVFFNIRRGNTVLRDIDVSIVSPDGMQLLKSSTLKQELLLGIPTLTGQTVRQTDKRLVRQIVEGNPYIDKASVSISIGCHLVVKATQRQTMARVFCGDKQFYIDTKGKPMPISTEGDASVTVCSGTFKQRLTDKYLTADFAAMATDSLQQHYDICQLYILLDFLHRNPTYEALFDQIYLQEDGDFALVPKIGNHRVVIGNTENLDDKFSRLLTFYQRALPETGWNAYSKVSVKYDGQIVCTRKNQI